MKKCELFEMNIKIFEGSNLVICLPGCKYSRNFVLNLINLVNYLRENNLKVHLSQGYSPEIHQIRCEVGGGSYSNGLYQSPFSNQLPYDYLLWIDSDIDFSPADFDSLITMDVDVATGWYYQANGLPAAGYFVKRDFPYPEKNNPPLPLYDIDHIYSFRNDTDIVNRTEPYRIDWCGMGWMLIRKGVMERLKYPWFAPKIIRYNRSEDYEVLSEDLSFALNLRDAGIEMWVHPGVKVGHEKPRTH